MHVSTAPDPLIFASELLPPLSDLMTNHLDTQDPHEAEEEIYMSSLDKNGSPWMQQPDADQECNDVAVLRSVPTRKPLGVFHAVSTRDGEAQARDGEAF